MLETVEQWLPIYSALVNTSLCAVAVGVLRHILKAKDAKIELLEARIRDLESRSVSAIHEENEALRAELVKLCTVRKGRKRTR